MSINNTEELRNFLSEQLEKVGTQEVTPAAANATANIAGKMLQSAKLELEYHKMAGITPNMKFLSKVDSAIKKLESKE